MSDDYKAMGGGLRLKGGIAGKKYVLVTSSSISSSSSPLVVSFFSIILIRPVTPTVD